MGFLPIIVSLKSLLWRPWSVDRFWPRCVFPKSDTSRGWDGYVPRYIQMYLQWFHYVRE